MQTEKQYAHLLETSLAHAKSGEPISFIGMYDCGKNYTFSLLAERISKTSIPTRVFLTGGLGATDEDWLQNTISELTILGLNQKQDTKSWQDVEKIFRSILAENNVCWVLNLGYRVHIPILILEMWQRLRDLYGTKFSYQIFANVHLLFDKYPNQALFDKITRKNIVYIIPLNQEDALVTLSMYEARFGKVLSPDLRSEVIRLSGGNPGILKALYLQASENHATSKWWSISDGRLHYRLERLISELPEEYQQALLESATSALSIRTFLNQLGYINNQNTVFSGIVVDYLNNKSSNIAPIQSEDELAIIMTYTERKVYALLKNHCGQIVGRDNLAQIIWGPEWATKYSNWALDQAMSQLRKKLREITPMFGELKTKRGEGYILIGVEHGRPN